MRPLETLSALLASLTILILLIPAWRKSRVALPVCLLSLVSQIAGVVIEQYRWQMIPLYLLAAVAFLLIMARSLHLTPARTPGRLARSVGYALLIGAWVAAIALPILLPVPVWPKTDGKYAVGTFTYDWVDGSRPDPFLGNQMRELAVQVWYPIDRQTQGQFEPYLSKAEIDTLASLLHVSPFFLDYLALIKTRSIHGARLSAAQAKYPLLIFYEGLGSFRTQSTYLMEELASQGYIVLSADSTHESALTAFPDGRITLSDINVPAGASTAEDAFKEMLVQVRLADTEFILGKLQSLPEDLSTGLSAGKLDFERVGAFGHSLGGGAAAQACQSQVLVKACLNMDGELRSNVTDLEKPLMLMETDHEEWASPFDQQRQTGRETALWQSMRSEAYRVIIQGAGHLNFTDIAFLKPPILRLFPFITSLGPIDGDRGLSIIANYTRAFFDRTLEDQPAPLLQGGSAQYPEVSIEVRSFAP